MITAHVLRNLAFLTKHWNVSPNSIKMELQ